MNRPARKPTVVGKCRPGEQAVLKRATSLVPEQRYPTCQDMLAELDAAVRAANLLDEVVPLSDAADQSNIPTELQATRLERGTDTDPSTVPTLSSVAVVPGLSASELSKAKTTPLGNITEPVQIPVTQQESVPLYAMPATAPFGGRQQQPPRSRKSRWVEATVCVIVVAGLIVWSLSGGVRQSNSPDVVTNREPSANGSPTNSVASGTSASEEKPMPVNRLATARELAATAAKEKRYADFVKALDPVFEQASATTDDYVMCGNSCLALADAGEMPAENYARAAADFEKADLPREQQRALTRQGRWLIDHNFPKQAIAPLRQAISLKNSSELQHALCQALLAMNNAKATRDEAIIGLAELPQDSSSDADLATAARLHCDMARTCLVFAKPIASHPELAKELEQFDVEAEQHFREALVRAISSKLDEHATWQDEFSAFQKLPRMLARVERRQRKEKIVELTKALEQSPNAAAQWIELAELEKLDGQTKSAATHFARGFGLQAMELARTGKLDEASKAEAKAAEHEADSVQVQYARALIAVGQGRHKDAVTLFDTVLSRSPQLPPLGDNESPSTAQQTLARLHHDRATALETLAVQENSKPDLALLEQAEKAFVAASSLAPNEPRYALSSGQNLLRQARSSTLGYAELLDRAAIILTTATKLDQQQAEAHFALGDCQFLRGKSAEAQAAFDQAVELAVREPIERQYQFSLSQSLAYLRAPRNDTKALAAADRAILLQRSAPAAHFARGLALRNLKRTNEAIAAFNDTLAAQPKHVGALIARSQLLIEHENATAKQLDQAQQDIETALAAAATDELKAEAFYVRSLAALKTHVSNVTQAATAEPALLKAQRDLLQAVKLMPSNTVFSQAATELFDYAAKVTWSDSQRKADSDSLQRDWKSARRQK